MHPPARAITIAALNTTGYRPSPYQILQTPQGDRGVAKADASTYNDQDPVMYHERGTYCSLTAPDQIWIGGLGLHLSILTYTHKFRDQSGT